MDLLTRIRALLQRRRAVSELDDEIAFHIAMETQANVARGLSLDEARRKALADFGGVARTREAVLKMRGFVFDSVWKDIRASSRSLVRSRGFTVCAVCMLALGIGIATAMFTIVDALVLRPVPFRDPSQLGMVQMSYEWGGSGEGLTPAVLQAWQDSPAFEGVEWARTDSAILETGGSVAMSGMATVTPGIFRMLGGVLPLRGRLFDPDARQGVQSDQIVISEALWRSQFGADPSIIGRTITVDDQLVTIVGVLPADFRFPAADTALWRPIDLANAPDELLSAYARFSSDIPREDAERLAIVAAREVEASNATRILRVVPLATGLQDAYSSRAVVILAGGVVLVFIVLCANVSGLMLARMTARRGEFGVRTVLGAARTRLMRQAFVESVLLGTLGAAIGAGVAWLFVLIAQAVIPPELLTQTLNPLDLDVRALAVTSIAALVATLGTATIPVWLGTRVDISGSLRGIDPRGTGLPGARVLGSGLLMVELALACTLLIGATLLMRSFVNLATSERGLETDGITTLSLSLNAYDTEDTAAHEAIIGTLEDELRAVPGVRQLVWSYGVPPRGAWLAEGQWTSDAPGSSPMQMNPSQYFVSAEFFEMYEIPIVSGRSLRSTDQSTDVVVSEQLAQALWQDVDPVGRSYRHAQASYHFGEEGVQMELLPEEIHRVVGVARETRFPSVSGSPGYDRPEVYALYSPGPVPMVSLRCEPACDIAAIRHRLNSTHAAVVVQDARLANADYAAALVRPRAAATLALVFAIVALLAAATGFFGVLLYMVNTRRREFGIRVALGASPAGIRRVILRDGFMVTIVGLGTGTLLAALLARALSALQYGVTASDPISIAIVVSTIGLTVVAAVWRPAKIAGSVSPAQLLREE